MTAEPFRPDVLRHLMRALNARWSEDEAVYRRELEDAAMLVTQDVRFNSRSDADTAASRIYETLDLLVVSLDFLMTAVEHNFGTPRHETADLLETIIEEQLDEQDGA